MGEPLVECIAQECHRAATARGWCAMHYQRWRVGSRGVGPNTPNIRGGPNHCTRCREPLTRRMQAPSHCEPCIRVIRAQVDRVADQWFALTLMEMWREAS